MKKLIASLSNNFHYNKKLQQNANTLRKNMTKAEVCLWKFCLQHRKLKGYQFRRQRPILSYIVDFVCLDLLLIIELDGAGHNWDENIKKDNLRDDKLAAVGFKVIRFYNHEVLKNLNGVSKVIHYWVEKREEEMRLGRD